MKKIISNVASQIDIEKITDQMYVGLIKDGEKYIVISRKSSTIYTYSRMNDNFHMLWESCTSKKILLKNTIYEEAYIFDTKKEMLHWLLN